MKLKTYNTILTELCDAFDALISPREIARSNNNIIYLIFKAIAKGLEVINNVCVALNNKFDPNNCSIEDLESVANLVGTTRLTGSGSGLKITITNTGTEDAVLKAGTYTYSLDEDTEFEFEVQSDVTIATGANKSYIAMSKNKGSYSVTEQPVIAVKSDQTIPDTLAFSCEDNASLLGIEDETDLSFRNRIVTDTERQNSIIELETVIKNLPYIFDCKVKFNNTDSSYVFDGITIPSFTAAIFCSGEIKNEIAAKIADKLLCPTVQTDDSVTISYYNEVFVSGKIDFYLIPFGRTEYSVNLTYKINNNYANLVDIETEIRTVLMANLTPEVHSDYVLRKDVQAILDEIYFYGVQILGIRLLVSGTEVEYVTVPVSRIPKLISVSFTEG